MRCNYKKFCFSKAFTLAEVMIVLTVIGIISAIIMPIAIQNVPKKEIMMFKKGHNTLYQVISTLVNSDKYYKDGDLGLKPDGTELAGDSTNTYFCQSFGDLVSAKKVDCADAETSRDKQKAVGYISLKYGSSMSASNIACNAVATNVYEYEITNTEIEAARNALDALCKKSLGESRIVTTDGITYFEVSALMRFGSKASKNATCPSGTILPRFFSEAGKFPATYHDQNGMDINYKVICLDVDNIPEEGSASCDDKTDICPFGYGIRADGRIMNGKRATEWLDKGLTDE